MGDHLMTYIPQYSDAEMTSRVLSKMYTNDNIIYKSYNGTDVYQNKPNYASWGNGVWSTVGGPYPATLVGNIPLSPTPDNIIKLRVSVGAGNVDAGSIFILVVNDIEVATGDLRLGGVITHLVNPTDTVKVTARGTRGGTASTHTIGVAVLCQKLNTPII